ncbi:type I-E CRISPR-associated protein Cas5/CasD [Streptomyces sp. CMB-StM0423]|uniref:type I-E CRISPR-associated protein Cas5/CasD n=1 Tax=Streptomyces sp. CMB-StM0423 TaxID=2059884 RepID=UPI000C70B365|nr:type I-E CRISPR-associated protein Cas5/CasD [Streptomyces sp. CMB-StM0423]AUH40556.1 type I-E CRISPR-associated protein Cas5/CasD [Streptomyces sp. CMB-StM0423]
MTGLLLHLAAPLQSWGEHSAFTDRDTVAHPTRSALIGMIAAAMGIPRAEALTDDLSRPFSRLPRLRFTIRIDRPGTHLVDFHTVGGGYPAHRTLPTAKGTRRGKDTATLVSHRHYLTDAAFTIAVTAPGDTTLLADCAHALTHPRWPLYLGRRSCPPAPPLLLRADAPDPVDELKQIPLARPQPTTHGTDEAATVTVRLTSDTPFNEGPHPAPSSKHAVTTLNDEPVRLTARDRIHHARTAYTTSWELPAEQCAGYGSDYLDALDTYLHPREG